MMQTAFLYAGVIVLAGFLAPQVGAATATQAVIAEIQAALDKGDALQAANLADAALKDGTASQSERAGLLLYRGLADELKGGHDDAMVDFTAALQIRAMPPEEREQALLQRGFLLDGLGRLSEAAGDYTAVIAMKGFSVSTALNNRANIYRRQNRIVEARRDYLAALSHVGSRPQYSYYGLGQIAEARSNKDEARAFYEKAVAADPGYLLAAERLAALGDATQASVAGVPVVLHPPARLTSVALAAEADSETDRRIVLRAPSTAGVSVEGTRPHPAKAGPLRSDNPILRPALDSAAMAVSGGREVQLGAWRSLPEAEAGWNIAQGRAGGLLEGLKPHIVAVDLPGRGRYYRLRTTQGRDSVHFCAALTAKGLGCLPVRD